MAKSAMRTIAPSATPSPIASLPVLRDSGAAPLGFVGRSVGVSGAGVAGLEVNGTGVTGVKVSGTGVAGVKVSGTGVAGLEVNGTGVAGVKVSGTGVAGVKVSGTGVTGGQVFPEHAQEAPAEQVVAHKLGEPELTHAMDASNGGRTGQEMDTAEHFHDGPMEPPPHQLL